MYKELDKNLVAQFNRAADDLMDCACMVTLDSIEKTVNSGNYNLDSLADIRAVLDSHYALGRSILKFYRNMHSAANNGRVVKS